MHEFESLELNNIVTYKHAKIKLNEYPLICIRGKNLDRGKAGHSSNASGKSLLLSTIPAVLYDSLPSSVRKNDSKDIVGHKDSFIKLNINNHKGKIEFHKYFKGSQKLDITITGKSLKPRQLKDAKARLRSIFPMTDDEFLSLVFIDGRSKSILQSGSSKIRFDFFEKLFKLNTYDILSSRVNKEYIKLKVGLQEIDLVSRELETKKKEIPVDIADVEKLEAKQEEIHTKFNKIRNKVDNLVEGINNTRTYVALAEGVDFSKSLFELKEDLKGVEDEEATINQLLRKSIKYYEAKENFDRINSKRKKLEKELGSFDKIILENLSYNDFSAKIKRQEAKLQDLLDKKKVQDNNNKKRKLIKVKLKEIEDGFAKTIDKYSDKPVEVITRSISNHKVECKNLNRSIQSLKEFIEDHDHAVCPTCLRNLDRKSAKSMVSLAEEQITKKTKQIKALGRILEHIELTSEYDELKYEPVDEDMLETYEKTIEKNKEKLKLIKRKEEIVSLLENLPNVEFDSESKLPPPDVYEELLPGLKERLSSLRQSIEKRRRIRKYNFDFKSVEDAKDQKKQFEFELNKYRPMLDKAQDILHSLTAKISIVKTIGKDISRLQEDISKLKLDTKDFKIFESLRKALGPKGLRKIRTSYFANQLQNNLNKFSPLIFGEKMVFKITVTNTAFDILAERNGRVSDVRRLSGSESSAFTCLLVLSILPFVKVTDRCNLLILDEIESGLDKPSKELFVNNFLPVLSQVVKNIIIITPQAEKEFYIPNAQQYLVVKKNKVSTLKKVEVI